MDAGLSRFLPPEPRLGKLSYPGVCCNGNRFTHDFEFASVKHLSDQVAPANQEQMARQSTLGGRDIRRGNGIR